MSDDDATLDLDAPEIAALLRGAAYLIAKYAALSTPEAQRDLALYGTTYHEVRGTTWTHVPMCSCGRPRCHLNAPLCLEHGGCCECGADEKES